MISELIQAQKEVSKHVTNYINDGINFFAALPKMPERTMMEGNRAITIREDGSKDYVELRKMEASATQAISKEFLSRDPNDVYKLLNDIAFELAKQRVQLVQESVNQAVGLTGNKIDYKDKITPQTVFNAYRKITLDFYDNGEPHELDIVSGPESKIAFESAFAEIKATPNLKREFETIIQEQRTKWRARESNRKLVG